MPLSTDHMNDFRNCPECDHYRVGFVCDKGHRTNCTLSRKFGYCPDDTTREHTVPLKITRLENNTDLDAKRMRLPYKITDTCPSCKTETTQDLSGHDYLSYPAIGQHELHFWCDECGDEWSRHIELVIEVKEA